MIDSLPRSLIPIIALCALGFGTCAGQMGATPTSDESGNKTEIIGEDPSLAPERPPATEAMDPTTDTPDWVKEASEKIKEDMERRSEAVRGAMERRGDNLIIDHEDLNLEPLEKICKFTFNNREIEVPCRILEDFTPEPEPEIALPLRDR